MAHGSMLPCVVVVLILAAAPCQAGLLQEIAKQWQGIGTWLLPQRVPTGDSACHATAQSVAEDEDMTILMVVHHQHSCVCTVHAQWRDLSA